MYRNRTKLYKTNINGQETIGTIHELAGYLYASDTTIYNLSKEDNSNIVCIGTVLNLYEVYRFGEVIFKGSVSDIAVAFNKHRCSVTRLIKDGYENTKGIVIRYCGYTLI